MKSWHSRLRRLSMLRIVLLGALAGVLAAQFVANVQHSSPFNQLALTEFATSWLALALGCLSGGTAGLFVSYLANYRTQVREPLLVFGFLLPVASSTVCASTIVWSAQVWQSHIN